MFDLSIGRFGYWVVDLIFILFCEDQNEVNNAEMFDISLSDLLSGRLQNNQSGKWLVRNLLLQFCLVRVMKNQCISQ